MKYAVFGLGVSGLSTLKYLATKTDSEVYAINQGPVESWPQLPQISQWLGREYMFSEADAVDVMATVDEVILSPGIPRSHELVVHALESGVKVICDIELAFRDYKGKIIAVTGTNGKTTTVTMISELLKKLNIPVFTGGNIGTAACDMLLDDKDYPVAVLEVSSFQLESIDRFHPHLAIVLNVTESHMERYESLDEYREAKYRIFKNCDATDKVILGEDLPIPPGPMKVDFIGSLSGIDFSGCKLLGIHNRHNFYCAYKVLEFFSVPNRDEIFQEFIREFKGVKHRLQFVASSEGIDFYNDAKSTNYQATKVAIEAVMRASKPVCLIVGGKLRTNRVNMLDTIKDCKLSQVIAFGEAADLIAENLKSNFLVTKVNNLEAALAEVKKLNFQGIVLFSPAFPSFDQYASYEKRGEHFLELVEQYSN